MEETVLRGTLHTYLMALGIAQVKLAKADPGSHISDTTMGHICLKKSKLTESERYRIIGLAGSTMKCTKLKPFLTDLHTAATNLVNGADKVNHVRLAVFLLTFAEDFNDEHDMYGPRWQKWNMKARPKPRPWKSRMKSSRPSSPTMEKLARHWRHSGKRQVAKCQLWPWARPPATVAFMVVPVE